MQITTIEYGAFQTAYDFFNAELFAGGLPQVLITLQRKAKSYGYFCADRFASRGGSEAAHELAMNPDGFLGRDDREILSTLAHEMAHVWQQTHGRAPRRCYHDRQWAAKMREIGLQPSSTGQPGGKETGGGMSHYIVEGGLFDVAYEKFRATAFKLGWQSAPDIGKDGTGKGGAKKTSKVKYTCPNCEANAWARPKAKLVCGECYEDNGVVIPMRAREDAEAEAPDEDEAEPEAA